MSRIATLYHHAMDITLKHKSTIEYGIVPIKIFDKLTKVNNGIYSPTYIRAMEDFIYEGEIEQICHV